MKRASCVFTVLFLLLGLATFSDHTVQSANPKTTKTEERPRVAPRSVGPSLTITFRGLMLFHPDPGRQFLSVEIPRAPHHEFTIQLIEKAADGLSSSSIYGGHLTDSESDIWWLESPSATSNVTFYRGSAFDRKSGKGDTRDYRWLLDLESAEFHGRKLSINKAHLLLTINVKGGEFYTRTTTLPLTRKQGEGSFEYFGRAAQEIATDVLLNDGDMVLVSETSVKELFRIKAKPDTTYELVFENLPQQHHQLAMNFNHFQYYYRLFRIPRAEWFEFKAINSERQTSLNVINASFFAPGTPTIPCMGAGYGNGGG